MDGFDAEDRELPTPLLAVDDATRDRLVQTLCAMVHGSTPEDIAGYLEDGFPDEVSDTLERPGEREEFEAHVDIVLSIAQAAD